MFDTNGGIIGYLSVRRKPELSGIQVVTDLYAVMLVEEKRVGAAGAIAASTKMLVDVLTEKELSYDELILSI